MAHLVISYFLISEYSNLKLPEFSLLSNDLKYFSIKNVSRPAKQMAIQIVSKDLMPKLVETIIRFNIIISWKKL